MIANKKHNEGRTITKSDIEKENSKFIALYDEAKKTGYWQDYELAMVQQLKGLIESRISENNFTELIRKGKVEKEDLEANAVKTIIEKLKSYNPRRSMPSSYFTIWIDHGLKDELFHSSKMSAHYIQKAIKLERIAKEYGYENIFDPNLSIEKLVKLSGEPMATILATRDQLQIVHVPFDETWMNKPSSGYENPSTSYVQKDDARFIAKVINSHLTPYQKFLVETLIMEEESARPSLNSLALWLKKPENMEKFGIDKTPEPTNIKAELQSALRSLKNMNDFRKRFGYRDRQSIRNYSVVEQAPMEFIEEALFPETGT